MSPAYKGYALALMTTVYTVNLIDRQLIGLLLQPIAREFALTDTQLGFLTGIAFGFFYALLGVPIARWADRGNRVTITSLAIGLWGITVASCVLVGNFGQLVFARVAASVGEAGCKPPTYSLVGDYFSGTAERTRAMSIYWLAGPIAGLIAYVVGGWLNQLVGWRMTFFIIGLPGIALALLVKLTIREPRSQDAAAPLPPSVPINQVLWQIVHRGSLRNLCIGLILIFTMFYGVSPWNMVFLMRSHGMSTAELGVWWGFLSGAAGISATLIGGYAANRWFSGDEPGQMRLSAASVASAVPFYVAFLLIGQKEWAVVLLAFWYFSLTAVAAPTFSAMQRLVPGEMRATVMALIMLFCNLIGMGLGPQAIGILSDLLRPHYGVDSLRYALFSVLILMFWAAYHFLRVAKFVRQDLEEVETVRTVAEPIGEAPVPA
jgi:MFS family permease